MSLLLLKSYTAIGIATPDAMEEILSWTFFTKVSGGGFFVGVLCSKTSEGLS